MMTAQQTENANSWTLTKETSARPQQEVDVNVDPEGASAASETNAVSRCVNLQAHKMLAFLHYFWFFFGKGPVGEAVCPARWRGRARMSPRSTGVGRMPLAALQGHVQSAPGRYGVVCCGHLLAPRPCT